MCKAFINIGINIFHGLMFDRYPLFSSHSNYSFMLGSSLMSIE